MIDHLKIIGELEYTKDKVWDAMLDVHNISPQDDDENLEKAQEYLDWAFSALCREIEKHEELHGKDWDTPLGDY